MSWIWILKKLKFRPAHMSVACFYFWPPGPVPGPAHAHHVADFHPVTVPPHGERAAANHRRPTWAEGLSSRVRLVEKPSTISPLLCCARCSSCLLRSCAVVWFTIASHHRLLPLLSEPCICTAVFASSSSTGFWPEPPTNEAGKHRSST
jgi:hypothetical protein